MYCIGELTEQAHTAVEDILTGVLSRLAGRSPNEELAAWKRFRQEVAAAPDHIQDAVNEAMTARKLQRYLRAEVN